MLVITHSQMTAFRQARLTDFAEQLARRARRIHPDATAGLDDTRLVAMMEAVIKAARARGLRRQSHLERFSDLSMTLGFGFESKETWARAIFANRGMSAADRLREAEASAVFIIRGA